MFGAHSDLGVAIHHRSIVNRRGILKLLALMPDTGGGQTLGAFVKGPHGAVNHAQENRLKERVVGSARVYVNAFQPRQRRFAG